MEPFRCYRCGEPGHVKAECTAPPAPPPASAPGQMDARAYSAHMETIEDAVADWAAGTITLDQKRRKISDENRRYYGPGVRKALTWP